jgi:hypothetical protein
VAPSEPVRASVHLSLEKGMSRKRRQYRRANSITDLVMPLLTASLIMGSVMVLEVLSEAFLGHPL